MKFEPTTFVSRGKPINRHATTEYPNVSMVILTLVSGTISFVSLPLYNWMIFCWKWSWIGFRVGSDRFSKYPGASSLDCFDNDGTIVCCCWSCYYCVVVVVVAVVVFASFFHHFVVKKQQEERPEELKVKNTELSLFHFETFTQRNKNLLQVVWSLFLSSWSRLGNLIYVMSS